jgi:uncharacterized protein (TIGR02246 family)
MNDEQAKQQIAEVIQSWLRATTAGDVDTILTLMADDVVFLVAGQPPMRGKAAFAAALRPALQHFRIEGTSDIQEIRILGDHAYCWNHLSMTMTPLQGGTLMRRAGNILSIFRKGSDGRWILSRDANLVTGV